MANDPRRSDSWGNHPSRPPPISTSIPVQCSSQHHLRGCQSQHDPVLLQLEIQLPSSHFLVPIHVNSARRGYTSPLFHAQVPLTLSQQSTSTRCPNRTTCTISFLCRHANGLGVSGSPEGRTGNTRKCAYETVNQPIISFLIYMLSLGEVGK